MPEIVTSRFTGFSKLYHDMRPLPPEKVCRILLKLLQKERAGMVVDIGCGTGLSSSIWLPFADEVIGIEPNDDMRGTAAREVPGASFRAGSSYATGLSGHSADIVSCSQSFHWMEPAATIAEVARILRPGGLFAVYDCVWPVTVGIRAELSYRRFEAGVSELCDRYREQLPVVPKWPKSAHFNNIADSGRFGYCRKIYFDHEEPCDARRFIGIAMSQGDVQTLRKNGIAELAPLIAEFEAAVRADLPGPATMLVSYEMIVAADIRLS